MHVPSFPSLLFFLTDYDTWKQNHQAGSYQLLHTVLSYLGLKENEESICPGEREKMETLFLDTHMNK